MKIKIEQLRGLVREVVESEISSPVPPPEDVGLSDERLNPGAVVYRLKQAYQYADNLQVMLAKLIIGGAFDSPEMAEDKRLLDAWRNDVDRMTSNLYKMRERAEARVKRRVRR